MKKIEKPAEAATSSNADAASSSKRNGGGIFFDWGNAGNGSQSSQPVEASSNAMDSEQEPAEAESVFSISSEDVIDAADMDTEEEEMPACGKKPASKAVKKKPGMKKPAAGSRKKPAKGSHAWEVSPSFGLVKATTASEKVKG